MRCQHLPFATRQLLQVEIVPMHLAGGLGCTTNRCFAIPHFWHTVGKALSDYEVSPVLARCGQLENGVGIFCQWGSCLIGKHESACWVLRRFSPAPWPMTSMLLPCAPRKRQACSCCRASSALQMSKSLGTPAQFVDHCIWLTIARHQSKSERCSHHTRFYRSWCCQTQRCFSSGCHWSWPFAMELGSRCSKVGQLNRNPHHQRHAGALRWPMADSPHNPPAVAVEPPLFDPEALMTHHPPSISPESAAASERTAWWTHHFAHLEATVSRDHGFWSTAWSAWTGVLGVSLIQA